MKEEVKRVPVLRRALQREEHAALRPQLARKLLSTASRVGIRGSLRWPIFLCSSFEAGAVAAGQPRLRGGSVSGATDIGSGSQITI